MNEPKDSKKSPKGLIKFSRVNGNIDCFGSEYQSESYVQLEIVEANVQKNIELFLNPKVLLLTLH